MFTALGAIISGVGSILNTDAAKNLTDMMNAKELTREQQVALLNLQNQSVVGAQSREIAIEKIDPRANWPLYTLMYIAIIIIGLINVEAFIYPQAFADYTKVIDTSLVSAVIYYLLGKNT